jgi:putative spermidine/putrescine transport system permease protein
MKPRFAPLVYFGPVLIFYVGALVLPYAFLLRLSFFRFSAMRLYIPDPTLDNYWAVLTDPFYLAMIGRTVALGAGVAAASLLLGFPLALKIARSGPRLKGVLMAVTLSPLLINLVVRTYAWLVLLGDAGVINRWLIGAGVIGAPLPINGNMVSVVIGMVHIGLPLMVLSLIGVIERIERSLPEAAESLGAGDGRILWRIMLPLAMPGIGSGLLLVFCFTISAFVTPAVLGGNRVATVSTMIYEKFTFSVNWPIGSTLVMVLLALTLVVVWLHGRVFREG